MYDLYGNPFKPFNKYPLELKEITEKITSGKPPISWDDILDFFLGLEKIEKRAKRNPPKKRSPKKDCKRLIKK